MATPLNIEIKGQGPDLIFIHGWGVNSGAFFPLFPTLSQYRVHYVDLPGYGLSPQAHKSLWLSILAEQLPDNAIWCGWSLGGVLATQMALLFPEKVKALVTIASSPCFMARKDDNWQGIAPEVLAQFNQQLQDNLPQTIARFLAIQAMGSVSAKSDIKQIKSQIMAKPFPQKQALIDGLEILQSVDLRQDINSLTIPWLRIWGKLDGLVPKQIISQLPHTDLIQDVLINKASHAPFISHSEIFINALKNWLSQRK